VVDNKLFDRLPELQGELDRLLEQTNHDISRLPNPPSPEPLAEIMRLIGAFVRDIEHLVTGSPDNNGLIQSLRGPRNEFKKEIRQTAPDFRPFEHPRNANPNGSRGFTSSVLPEPRFLSHEEPESEWHPVNDDRAIFIDDVMKRANS
jgi:hypothetical protein